MKETELGSTQVLPLTNDVGVGKFEPCFRVKIRFKIYRWDPQVTTQRKLKLDQADLHLFIL